MPEYTCGIDFGTSNSAIAVAGPEAEPFLIKLENAEKAVKVIHDKFNI